MLPLAPALVAEIQKPHGDSPFVTLFQIVADRNQAATPTFQLVKHPSPVVFGADTYYPFPIEVGPIIVDDEGSLPEVDLVISNATRELARYAEVGLGFMGASCTATRTHIDHAASGLVIKQGTFHVASSTINNLALTLRLQIPNLHVIRAPQDVMTRDRCRYRYGSPACGAVLDAVLLALHPVCDKRLVTCRAIGNSEVSLGRARLHPRRYGGFPGLPRDVR